MQSKKTIAIIGGGPSGLMAAEILAAAGHKVTLYDQMPTPGRKFLLAGRGGLNLTHSEPLKNFMGRYGAAADWLTPSLQAFPPTALRDWCENLGQETFIGSSGRVFPRAMKASPLLRAWRQHLDHLGVRFMPRHRWLGWEQNALRFKNGEKQTLITTDATLLALGGASWPKLGSDGGWVDILAAEAIAIAPLRPANCGFIVPWSDHFRSRFAGQPLKPVIVTIGSVSRQGEAIITAQGLEGGVIYALAALLRETIAQQGQATINLDLRPTMPLTTLTAKLQVPRSNQSLSNYLRKAGLSPLLIGLLRETTAPDKLAHASPAALAALLKAIPLTLTASSGIERAISTAGGIERTAVDANFMLHQRPGTFVAGEMLDWEAPTGGYLLQACLSTAVAAANGIIRWLD